MGTESNCLLSRDLSLLVRNRLVKIRVFDYFERERLIQAKVRGRQKGAKEEGEVGLE